MLKKTMSLFPSSMFLKPLFALTALALALNSANAADLDKGNHSKLKDGKVVYFKHIPAQTKAEKPTLIYLPGVNRGVPEDYKALGLMSQLGYSGVITATSSHWQSLQGNKETPYFKNHPEMRYTDFTKETEALVKDLKIANPVLISLSYSSAIAYPSKLRKIFVGPLVKPADTNPEAAQVATMWESGLAMNPIFGGIWIRQYRDANYYAYWSTVVNQTLFADANAFSGVDSGLVIDGYTSISRAIEDFDFSKVSFKESQGPYDFILGENEAKNRLRGQIITAQNASKNAPTRVIIVRGADHDVMGSQPVGYTAAVDYLLQNSPAKSSLQIGIMTVDKDNSNLKWLSTEESKKLTSYILKFDDLVSSADLSEVLGK